MLEALLKRNSTPRDGAPSQAEAVPRPAADNDAESTVGFAVVTHEGTKEDLSDSIRVSFAKTGRVLTLTPRSIQAHTDAVAEVQQGVDPTDTAELTTFMFELPNVDHVSMSGGRNTALLEEFNPATAAVHFNLTQRDYDAVLAAAQREYVHRLMAKRSTPVQK